MTDPSKVLMGSGPTALFRGDRVARIYGVRWLFASETPDPLESRGERAHMPVSTVGEPGLRSMCRMRQLYPGRYADPERPGDNRLMCRLCLHRLRQVGLWPPDGCRSQVHDYPLSPVYAVAVAESDRRIESGWDDPFCDDCGAPGWAPPAELRYGWRG